MSSSDIQYNILVNSMFLIRWDLDRWAGVDCGNEMTRSKRDKISDVDDVVDNTIAK